MAGHRYNEDIGNMDAFADAGDGEEFDFAASTAKYIREADASDPLARRALEAQRRTASQAAEGLSRMHLGDDLLGAGAPAHPHPAQPPAHASVAPQTPATPATHPGLAHLGLDVHQSPAQPQAPPGLAFAQPPGLQGVPTGPPGLAQMQAPSGVPQNLPFQNAGFQNAAFPQNVAFPQNLPFQNAGFPQNGFPQNGFPQNGFPQNGFPQPAGFPQRPAGYPQQPGYPPQPFPFPQGLPPQNAGLAQFQFPYMANAPPGIAPQGGMQGGMQGGIQGPGFPGPQKVLTVDEIEAQLMQPPTQPAPTQPTPTQPPAEAIVASATVAPASGTVAPAPGTVAPAPALGTAALASPPSTDEDLVQHALAKIEAQEREVELRSSKAAKIAAIAKYNNLMSNSDKDFITRIQVSQIVSGSGSADDFYYQSIKKREAAPQTQAPTTPVSAAAAAPPAAPAAPDTAPANGHAKKRSAKGKPEQKVSRKEAALQRMAQSVQRLVDSARDRQQNRKQLEGALGGGLTSRARDLPRVKLQTDDASMDQLHELAEDAAARGHAVTRPLSSREAHLAAEKILGLVVDIEAGDAAGHDAGNTNTSAADAPATSSTPATPRAARVKQLMSAFFVHVPLDSLVPHPFASVLATTKGKKALSRAIPHLGSEQQLTLITFVLSLFGTLDVVAPDVYGASPDAAADAFVEYVIPAVMHVANAAPLRIIAAMAALLCDRADIFRVVSTRAGAALVTTLLARAELLKQAGDAPEDAMAFWASTYSYIFASLEPRLLAVFPSAQIVARRPDLAALPVDVRVRVLDHTFPALDAHEQPFWQLMAAIAVSSSPAEQELLVTGLRDKIMDDVSAVDKGWAATDAKKQNVNVFLHAIGLDASLLA